MHIHFSPQTIGALAQVISGGDGTDRIGIYRSGSKLESFMRGCNVSMRVGSGSRLPTLVDAIEDANRSEDQTILRNIAEQAADPRDFLDEPERQQAVVDYLNARLRYDGLELQIVGGKARLLQAGQSAAVIDALVATVAVIDFDTVNHDLERALANADADPEDAVTAACSILESVCRSILVELGLPLPAHKDIQGLYRAVRGPLGLDPAKTGVPDLVADDVRAILGGLNTTIGGIGALRTHGGDAHGRERGTKRIIDRRIARLAIHSASAASLFLIETWQFRFPSRTLHSMDMPG
ncbi:Abortive infection C-terminus [Devosia lucknowensis]|uniref:Abortive infection C-terminus n=1 Tax=Devosia lucknowensis TaxID=1096929 RepID=A0A1Y6F836_9HYPH|nr:abortive infection family protein [Devosia lucknowensis]SMQ68513.1 Abortive infection C-terminus [Devosia lucknowensis]